MVKITPEDSLRISKNVKAALEALQKDDRIAFMRAVDPDWAEKEVKEQVKNVVHNSIQDETTEFMRAVDPDWAEKEINKPNK